MISSAPGAAGIECAMRTDMRLRAAAVLYAPHRAGRPRGSDGDQEGNVPVALAKAEPRNATVLGVAES